jgi:hypothetical protein
MGIDEPRPSNAACGLGRAGTDIRADANSACPIIPLAFVAMSPSSSVCGFFPRLIDRRPRSAAAAPNHSALAIALTRGQCASYCWCGRSVAVVINSNGAIGLSDAADGSTLLE